MAKTNAPTSEPRGLKKLWTRVRDYFSNVYSELKKVHWPDRRQLMIYTGIVLFVVTLVALILWLFDQGVSALLSALFSLAA